MLFFTRFTVCATIFFFPQFTKVARFWLELRKHKKKQQRRQGTSFVLEKLAEEVERKSSAVREVFEEVRKLCVTDFSQLSAEQQQVRVREEIGQGGQLFKLKSAIRRELGDKMCYHLHEIHFPGSLAHRPSHWARLSPLRPSCRQEFHLPECH